MFRFRSAVLPGCLAALAVWTLPTAMFAQSPWADKSMPVTTDMMFWIDASVQEAATNAPLKNATPIANLKDGSGNGLDFVQENSDAQPQWYKAGSFSFLRFDGIDDLMLRQNAGVAVSEFSAFIYASVHSNTGMFRSYLSGRAPQSNDFQTGFNIDFGSNPSRDLQVINIEGVGMAGQGNVLADKTLPMDKFQLVEIRANPKSVEVYIDGQLVGQRERNDHVPNYNFNEIGLGCRLVINLPPPLGCLDGDIAEAIAYKRRVSDDERTSIEGYFKKKYAGIDEAVAPLNVRDSYQLKTLENPPLVQMFEPGFSVHEMKIDLTNINNVLYREDGVLVALAYDGKVYLLRDTDGDGLEDEAKLFWDNRGANTAPIGMALTPPNYEHGRGLFVPSRGKVSLIADTDGDDVADKETVIAEGWEQISAGVDSIGIAVDPSDHSVWFGLGTKDYTNAYILKDGQSGYDLKNERGTIIRVAPDLKSREIACTGIRFPVGIRFNADGELFCTEQEGATWLANGNPYDELLHIRRNKHFGFPPQHPKHLPNVIDEPSVYDYGPQHQSTCGLNFNEPAKAGGPIFGPQSWRHNALVTGYSRGKLYRTELVRTEAGYVAQNHLIGSTQMLPADACVTPQGDMVVAIHSGGPDWGSGPAGKGKLVKVRYAKPDLPQPVAVWAENERQVRIAFDKALQPEQLTGLSSRIKIDRGPAVRAGDEFETFRPGYAVVQHQLISPRRRLEVTGLQVTPDRRTLILDTAPQGANEYYAISMPSYASETKDDRASTSGDIAQLPVIDLDYSLAGVQATLTQGGAKSWSGWLPHLSSEVNHAFTDGSADHEAFQQKLAEADSLTLQTQIDVRHMLHPDVQPGSKIDYEYPAERVEIELNSSAAIDVKSDKAVVQPAKSSDGSHMVVVSIDNSTADYVPLTITLKRTNSNKPLDLKATWHTAADSTQRAFPLRRFLQSWVNTSPTKGSANEPAPLPPELAGGSWGQGRKVFFGAQANCSKCHRMHGTGGNVGPDLSNLRHRDYKSVLRDITDPSFAINPDHLSYSILLNDGKIVNGLVKYEQGKIAVGNEQGEVIRIDQSDVEEIRPSTISIMPKGIPELLGQDKMRDLMTFLLTVGPVMPDDLVGRPPLRTRNELNAVLAGSEAKPADQKPINILLVAGAKDHGPGEHDYPAWQRAWTELFRAADNVTVTTATDFPTPEQFKNADAIVFYQRGTWNAQRAGAIDEFLKRGGGVSYIHWAVEGEADPEGFANRIGLASSSTRIKYRHGPLDLQFKSEHPVARNLGLVKLVDESYWKLIGDPRSISLLATAPEEDAERPLIWCHEHTNGRVFVSIPGHYSWSFDDPIFRTVLLRGIAWTAGESVDRFNDLIPMGVQFAAE